MEDMSTLVWGAQGALPCMSVGAGMWPLVPGVGWAEEANSVTPGPTFALQVPSERNPSGRE